MCDVCKVFGHVHTFDCPDVTEWPDHPWDKETRIREDHAMARFRRRAPDLAEQTIENVAEIAEECSHDEYTHMVQDWQGVDVLCNVCKNCGATVNLFQDW